MDNNFSNYYLKEIIYFFNKNLKSQEDILISILIYGEIEESNIHIFQNLNTYNLNYTNILNDIKVKIARSSYNFKILEDSKNHNYYSSIWKSFGIQSNIQDVIIKINYYRKLLILTELINYGYINSSLSYLNNKLKEEKSKLYDEEKYDNISAYEDQDIYTPYNIKNNIDKIIDIDNDTISLPTKSLNNITEGGLNIGGINIVGATPGTGKTIFALQTIYANLDLIKDINNVVLYFTPDMHIKHVYNRLFKIMYGKNIYNYTKNDIISTIQSIPIIMSESSDLDEILNIIDIYKNEAKIIVIDYIQLIRVKKNNCTRTEEIAYISNTIKKYCMEYNIVAIFLSQVNREHSRRNNSELCLNDLKDSSHLEQIADSVIFLNKLEDNKIKIVVKKNRHGKLGECTIIINTLDFSFFETDN